jgi:hypothetical protein
VHPDPLLDLNSSTHGSEAVELLKNSKLENQLLYDLQSGLRDGTIEELILMSKLNISANPKEPFLCEVMKLPEKLTERKYHIIGFERILEPKECDPIVSIQRNNIEYICIDMK